MNIKINKIVTWLVFTILLAFAPLLIKLYGSSSYSLQLKTTELFSELFFVDLLLAMSSIQLMAFHYELKYCWSCLLLSIVIIVICIMCYNQILSAEYANHTLDLAGTSICLKILTPISVVENIICFIICELYQPKALNSAKVETM